MKMCARCAKLLPAEEFYQVRPGAFSSRCKGCHGVEVRPCRHCGQHFVGKAGRRFCSPACRQADRTRTYRTCPVCGAVFGPLDHLSQRFCSVPCAVEGRRTGRRTTRKTSRKARNAQNLLRYHVQAGHITRPDACEQCGATGRRIEGAHADYDEPLRVRWLCVSCHRRWDKREPKGVTWAVPIAPAVAVTQGQASA